MNPEEEIEMRKKIFREFASKGGKARARNLSPEKRKAIAREAAKARWKNKKKK